MTVLSRIVVLKPEFEGWDKMLALILRSFAYMAGVVDPPSSAFRLTAERLREKAGKETVFAIFDGDTPVACLFCDPRGDVFYLGKLAVDPRFQGKGLAKTLLKQAEELARRAGFETLELQVRKELEGNHAFFSAQGFVKRAEGAHEGYARPTWLMMQKQLAKASA
jgi:GNAT superfamily N-acetyltransferase